MNVEQALCDINEKGWTHVPSVYDESLIEEVKDEFHRNEHQFQEIQRRKGLEEETRNATHHTLLLCRSMLKLLEENKVHPVLEAYFDGKYILSTMGLSYIPPSGRVYTQNIHRDTRSYTGSVHLWVNTLIMLDDSTAENGATLMLQGSHKTAEKPDQDLFNKQAIVAEGKKGDVLIFDGNIWHSAGQNRTNQARHIITPIYCKPFIKQQLDYPRAFGKDFSRTISPHLKQILGYNALSPSTLEEFYQKPGDRYYKADQG